MAHAVKPHTHARVPQLDALVAGARHNLSVVSREGDRQDVLVVTREALRRLAGRQVPETESGVPRARQGELAVRREGNILQRKAHHTES